MPARKQGGTNNTRPRRCPIKWMPIEYPDPKKGQLYAIVDKPLGSCQFSVIALNNDTKLAAPRGTIAKQGRIRKGDCVIIEPLSANEAGKYQIIFKYTPEQYKSLEKEGLLKKIEIPVEETVVSAHIETFNVKKKDDGFCFAGEEEDEIRKMLNIDDGFIDDI
jgi:initiation factor 1A